MDIAERVFESREKIHYFDFSATCFMPRCVIDKWVEVNEVCGVSIGRGNSSLTKKAEEYLNDAEDEFFDFFGVSQDYEMVYAKNVTEAINVVSLSVKKLFAPLDIIMVAPYEHHSNYLPWKRLATDTGALFFEIPIDENGDVDLKFIEKYKNRVKLIALSSVSNSFGYTLDVKAILDCLSTDTVVVVDESQLVGHDKIYVDDRVTVHLLASHKMYGPKNIAGFYAKKSFLEMIDPVFLGGGMVERVGYVSEWKSGRDKFVAGTLDISLISAWAEACRYLKRLSFESIKKQEKIYMERISASLKKSGNIVVGNREKCCDYIITFYNEKIHAHDINDLFCKNGIIIRSGNLCAQNAIRKLNNNAVNRISLGIGVDERDVDCLCELLEGL